MLGLRMQELWFQAPLCQSASSLLKSGSVSGAGDKGLPAIFMAAR